MNREVKSLITSLSKEMNLKIEDVERAYEAPFALQAILMKYRCDREKLYFPSLRVPYFGLFYCPEWHKKRLLKKNNEAIRSDKQPDSNI
jgi:hypothetical protein